MRDINFFNIYKRKSGKNKGLKIFLIVFVSLLILANLLLAGGYFLLTTSLQAEIDELNALINAEDTRAKIDEANRLKAEAALTSEYLKVLQNSSDKLAQMDLIDTILLDKIRQLTPLTTTFSRAEYNGTLISLECQSQIITDPMDMYHAFLGDSTFATVTISGITVDASGSIAFNIFCQLAGGESQ